MDLPKIGAEQISAANKVKIQPKIGNLTDHIPPLNGKDFGVYKCMDLCGYPTKDPQNPHKIKGTLPETLRVEGDREEQKL